VLAEFLTLLLSAAHGPSYSKPVPTPVVRVFEAPVDAYSAGHRGVDLATVPGEFVRAAAAGDVAFVGTVADRGIVVIAHPDGVRTEYEPLTPLVVKDEVVTAGEVIGVLHGLHGDCAEGGCLHWGARRGDEYFDPLSLLAAQRRVVRLLPWDD
jgi:murein DD-endopeptidase MepM/ murein hydrolase activator NlpD